MLHTRIEYVKLSVYRVVNMSMTILILGIAYSILNRA